MTDQRFIIEMGMGTDFREASHQKAAERAIDNAYSHVTLPLWRSAEIDPSQMRLLITIAVQDPDQIDTDALAARMPEGRVEVHAVFGGQVVAHPGFGGTSIVATAAIEAFLPYQGGRWKAV